jgi:hypothetical protein
VRDPTSRTPQASSVALDSNHGPLAVYDVESAQAVFMLRDSERGELLVAQIRCGFITRHPSAAAVSQESNNGERRHPHVHTGSISECKIILLKGRALVRVSSNKLLRADWMLWSCDKR